jgi:transcription antitermination factor NusG
VERRWAVLRSKPRYESLAARAVESRGVECYLPRLPARRASRAARLLFPGYLFAGVQPDSDDLVRIRSVPGVAYVLPRSGQPALLPEPLIEAIRHRERELFQSASRRAFTRGDRVVVVSGPFKWVEGIFDRGLSPHGRVRILVNMVRGSAAVQMAADDLEQVAATRRPAARRARLPEPRLRNEKSRSSLLFRLS